jgi:hypothetical protein
MIRLSASCPAVVLALALAAAACGGGNNHTRPSAGQDGVVERDYLTARREERACPTLRNDAEAAFAQRNQGAALDASELLLAYCPQARLVAMEQTQVMLARTEAKSGGAAARSVRLRLALPLPAGQRLLWLGAYADRKLGLNNLALGPHRIDVELHLWAQGSAQMLRVAGAIDVSIDGRMPVLLDVAVAAPAAGSALMPLALAITPGTTQSPGGAGVTTGRGVQQFDLARDKIPFPRPPHALAQAGLPSSIELELCFDERGRVTRVDPLAWPHPRYLGNYVDSLRTFRMRPFIENGVPIPFCTGWRQTVEAPVRTESRR